MLSITKLIEEKEKLNQIVKAENVKLGESLKQVFKEFFEAFPNQIKVIQWTQYTPYFNDGEPCVFSAGDVVFSTQEVEDEDEDENEDLLYVYRSDKETDAQKKGITLACYEACLGIEKFIEGSGDILEPLFGDGVKVRVTSSGIDIQDYDHD